MLPVTLPDRIRLLRWAFPFALAVLVALYQLGLARWVHDRYSDPVHFGVEILFYGTGGPVLAFWVLTLIGHWLDEKEHAEKQARASERRLASITAASADAILGLDSAGHIESWNRGAELLFGFSAGEIRGRRLVDLFGGGEAAEVEFRWLAETVRQAGFVRGHETVCRDAEGREVVVELTATRLTDEAGRAIGMSVILRDVTDRKRREQEIRRLNANLNEQVAERTRELAEKVEELARANADLQKLDRMRSEFVSLVSHQIRAPLTNMQGAIERLQSRCGAVNAACGRILDILHEEANRLARLVDDVLNAERIESGRLMLNPEPLAVLPLMQQAADELRARGSGRHVRLPFAPVLPPVLADRDCVLGMLVNLLDNADKYTPPETAVSVEVAASDLEVTISVRDFGPGFGPADLERVFEKFYRADNGDAQRAYGYGIGLYICRKLAEAHGGRIWAENAPGGGAVFSFTLPVAR